MWFKGSNFHGLGGGGGVHGETTFPKGDEPHTKHSFLCTKQNSVIVAIEMSFNVSLS